MHVRYVAQRDSGTDGSDVTSHLTSNAPTEIKVRTCVCVSVFVCVCVCVCVCECMCVGLLVSSSFILRHEAMTV